MLKNGLPEALREVRERLGLTQKELEKRGSIPNGTVSKWERGERLPGEDQKHKLLKGLECTEIDLWEKAKKYERAYYVKMAIENNERVPDYDVSLLADQVNRLLALDMAEVPDVIHPEFNVVRQMVATQISQNYSLIDRIVGLHEKLVRLSGQPGFDSDSEDDLGEPN